MNIYNEVGAFYEGYRGEKRIIGKSADGRNLYAMKVGAGERPVGIVQYAMHAREWITALLGLEHIRRGGVRGCVWILPLMNPDGALLATQGIESAKEGRREFLKKLNGGEDFSLWKANAEGVDLNVNFDARWGTGKKNLAVPAPENYIGTAPFCALESVALRDFTLEICPDYTISYHTKGEEIYWRFRQPVFRAARDKRLGRILAEATGYSLKEAKGSAGGYKDWCVEKLKIPAFTIEAGRDELMHPLGLATLNDILGKNLEALVAFTQRFE